MNTSIMKPTGLLILGLTCATSLQVLAQDTDALLREFRGETPMQTRDAAKWQSDYAAVLNSLLPDMASDDLGKRDKAQNAWEKVVLHAATPATEIERAAVARAMLPKIGADSPLEVRLWLLKMLEWSGRGEAVSAVAAQLNDPDAQVQERARRALANNSSPEANTALRTALQNSTAANRASFVNALGFRHDASNIATLGKYLQDGDEAVVRQAILALGDANTPEALKLLSAFQTKASVTMRPIVTDALLENAERAVRERRAKDAAPIYTALLVPANPPALRSAALRGLVLANGIGALPQLSQILGGTDDAMRAHAARLTLLIPGDAGTKSIAAMLPKLPAAGQILLLNALADRGDASAQNAINDLTKSTDDGVRAAAVNALGALGGATNVTNLLAIAASDKSENGAARDALGRLGAAQKENPEVDAKLIENVRNANPKIAIEAIHALSARRTQSATPAFLTALQSDAPLSTEAARALGEVGSPTEIASLVSWMQKGGDTGVAEKALGNIFARTDKTKLSAAPLLQVLDTPNLSAPLRASTFRLLGSLGTSEGFDRVKAAATDANADVRDAAIRALADWPSDAAIAPLLDIARADNKPVQQVLALRGVARLVGKSGQNDDAKIVILRDGIKAAKRGEEKQLMLGTLGDIKTLPSLRAAAELLDDAGLRDSAAAAMLKIAKELRGQSLKDARPLLEQAANSIDNADTKRDLQEQIKRAG